MNRLDLIRSIKPVKMAEIGVLTGQFSEQLLTIPSLKVLHLVDPWKTFDGPYSLDPANVSQGGQDSRHREVVKKFLPKRGKVRIMRMESLIAAPWFPDKSLCAAFIDAQHDEESVFKDLVAWSRVAKTLFAHDYTDRPEAIAMGFGVKIGVRRFCEDFGWAIQDCTDEEWPTVMMVDNNRLS